MLAEQATAGAPAVRLPSVVTVSALLSKGLTSWSAEILKTRFPGKGQQNGVRRREAGAPAASGAASSSSRAHGPRGHLQAGARDQNVWVRRRVPPRQWGRDRPSEATGPPLLLLCSFLPVAPARAESAESGRGDRRPEDRGDIPGLWASRLRVFS